jgi:hypothetical protein
MEYQRLFLVRSIRFILTLIVEPILSLFFGDCFLVGMAGAKLKEFSVDEIIFYQQKDIYNSKQ